MDNVISFTREVLLPVILIVAVLMIIVVGICSGIDAMICNQFGDLNPSLQARWSFPIGCMVRLEN